MGWFGGPPSKVSAVAPAEEQNRKEEPQFLEDLPPKFQDQEPQKERQPTYGDAIQKLKFSDFNLDNFVMMPCFREAMMTGFQAMGVLGAVTFLIHKNPARSANWGICGFFLGTVVGWEQCRSIRRKSFQTVEAAKKANQAKIQKKFEEGQTDDLWEKFNDVQQGK